MKIWKSFSGEHSANLKIVGTFKTEANAEEAAALFAKMRQISEPPVGEDGFISKELSNFNRTNDIELSPSIVYETDYCGELTVQGNTVEIYMDDFYINPIIQAIVSFGGDVNISTK